MFNSENATKAIPVSIRLNDGNVQQGNLIIAMTSDLKRTLNGDSSFFEFENMAGEKSFFSKHAVAQVSPIITPKVKKLDTSTIEKGFDPFRILKVGPDADAQTIHHAYLEQAKLYHPDHFTNIKLPKEMAEYAENMVRLVNAAYNTLNKDHEQPASDPVQPEATINL